MNGFLRISLIGMIGMMFLAFSTLAQENKKDYVILQSGLKVSGQIVRSFDHQHYNSVKFISLLGEENTYLPSQIAGFGLDNGRLFYSVSLPGETVKVFAQQLLTGTLSLLGHKGQYYIDNGRDITYLEAKYQETNVSGKTIVSFRKPYIGTLNILMAGECGAKLGSAISTTQYSEQSLIDILVKYHLCEGIPYEVHVERIPLLKLSPFLMVGAGTISSLVSSRMEARQDAFENKFTPSIIVGLKGYNFRNMPKIGFDFGLGYTKISNVVNSAYENHALRLTGTEEFNISTVLAPFFVNYSIYKNPQIETYLGIGGVYRMNTFKSDFAIQDRTTIYNEVTVLQEKPYVEYRRNIMSPSIKLGGHFKHQNKLGFLLEMQVGYLRDSYTMTLEANTAIYNELMTSILFGIRY